MSLYYLDDDRPLKIINAFENKSAAIMRLQNFDDKFLYVVNYLDKNISKYLTESEEAINFYYTVEEQSSGIKISFAIIYIIIVSLLLFISISIAIRFSSRFFRSINNLILASTSIGEGNLDTKVPEVKTDKDLEILNKNFNQMIERLKNQQDKLIINERHEAWGNLARKMAHEIKNPLTPIQLSAERIRKKFSPLLGDNSEGLRDMVDVITRQTDDLRRIVDEFSKFARMPELRRKNEDLNALVSSAVSFQQAGQPNVLINLSQPNFPLIISIDPTLINQALTNILKNAGEAIETRLQSVPTLEM